MYLSLCLQEEELLGGKEQRPREFEAVGGEGYLVLNAWHVRRTVVGVGLLAITITNSFWPVSIFGGPSTSFWPVTIFWWCKYCTAIMVLAGCFLL